MLFIRPIQETKQYGTIPILFPQCWARGMLNLTLMTIVHPQASTHALALVGKLSDIKICHRWDVQRERRKEVHTPRPCPPSPKNQPAAPNRSNWAYHTSKSGPITPLVLCAIPKTSFNLRMK